jgi:two-component system, cell cycle sensor histidine kinase and response regulator CckA
MGDDSPDPAALQLEVLRLREEVATLRSALRSQSEPGAPGRDDREALFRAVYDQAKHFAAILAPDGTVRHVNRAACAFIGCDSAEVVGRPFWETPWWVHSVTAQAQLRDAIARATRGEVIDFETSNRTADGSLRSIDVTLRTAQDGQGQVLGLICEGWDITPRRQAEESAERTRLFLEGVLEQTPVPIAVVSAPDLVVRYHNRAAAELLGVADEGSYVNVPLAEVHRRQTWQDFLPDGTPLSPNDLPLARALRGEVTLNQELYVERKDGTRAWELASATPIHDRGGQLVAAVLVFPDITERKESEAAAHQAARDMAWLMKSMAHAFAVWDMEYDETGPLVDIRFGYFNDAYERVSGLQLDQVRGKTVREVWPETEQSWYDVYDEVARTGQPRSFEMYHKPTRGLYSCTGYRPGDMPDRVCVVFEEVTERKQTMERLRQLADEQRTVLDTITIGVCQFKKRKLQWANPAFLAMLGYSLEEVLGVDAAQFYAARDDYERVGSVAYPRLAEGSNYITEVAMRRKDGSVCWCILSGQAIDPHNVDGGVIWALQNITERRSAEAAAHEGQERLALALQGADLGSWDWDITTNSVRYDERWAEMLGYRLDEIEPHLRSWESLLHPDDVACAREVLASHLAGKTASYEVEHRLRHKSGSWVWVLSRGKVIARDATGKPLRAVGTHLDVTERRLKDEALRESAERFERLVQNSSDITAVADAEGRLLSISGPVKTMLGVEPEELVGRCVFDDVHAQDLTLARAAFGEATANPGTAHRVECRFRHKNGDWIPTETVGTSWLHDPLVHGVVLNTREISERKNAETERSKLQEQLQQAMKMEAVGRLAGGVAHDFNNVLTIILGFVELAGTTIELSDTLKRYLDGIAKAADSAASLTRQLLAFSRRQIVQPRVLSLNHLVENLRPMLVRLIGEDVDLQTVLAADLGATRIDPGQFDQVLANLTVNARDAMPGGGRLTIETANIELDDSYCLSHTDLRPGTYVLLAVSDNGQGIDEAVKQHIFEPFFTTKARGHGTGLGLAVIFGIVKQAGGTIEVYSELGRGTTFKIYLPRVAEPAELLSEPSPSAELPRGSETVLLAEDEAGVRELAASMLERLGYEVLVAPDGPAALALAERRRLPIALLLTDVVMPGMSGRELSERLRELHPETRVLYTSGYTEDVIVLHGVLEDHLNFIGKPFSIQALAKRVRQALSAQP